MTIHSQTMIYKLIRTYAMNFFLVLDNQLCVEFND